ncbi:OmpA family protein [Mesorhizobium opportunistum]|uniref:OmpA family protein n=2 Tax=Mesorhizobium TaxID=68287 RepID=A0ABV1YR90_9HYPH|nr:MULTISPECIES: OmpA family protein [Mesorhizobium]ESY68944.1 flagellar motor protein MotB [Mesorhizobium sp. LNHC232B00]TIN94249.1 MAG: flagellar motor protein MotB [Mesorhizobium sp.]TJU93615.1 MAG: flagellar motor protein MotB [Mesorhizobium sp.]TJV16403.1 MAG: flagellar motor protein MotB [Mesorhizobium sp.]TJV41256.1 MAG: flagellar motor protein MotB [Mesorhizobium sp.]
MFEVVAFWWKTTSKGLAAARALGLALLLLFGSQAASAAPNWTLDPAASVITYQSVKKNTIVETNKIRNITGTLSAAGDAKVTFDLNSVDTGVDLRNVRMRFLFFETFKYPTAELTAKVDPAAFADLATKRRVKATLPFRLNLHGVDKDLEASVVVTMISDTMVSVASEAPVAVHVEDFGLLPNVDKLQQAANVTNIVPTASVSFDFVFAADGTKPATTQAAAASSTDVGPVTTDAAKANFSDEECLNRFAVLSRTGAIYFRPASARLDAKSRPLLEEVEGVVGKCPGLKVEVSGYTDSDGSPEANKQLSERRAQAVADAIVAAGIARTQITATGYGEERPVAANDTPKNKALNRRIEFSATKL